MFFLEELFYPMMCCCNVSFKSTWTRTRPDLPEVMQLLSGTLAPIVLESATTTAAAVVFCPISDAAAELIQFFPLMPGELLAINSRFIYTAAAAAAAGWTPIPFTLAPAKPNPIITSQSLYA